ncbi:peptidoglycan-binding domain-containing protein [Streptomyces sp. NPDC055897]
MIAQLPLRRPLFAVLLLALALLGPAAFLSPVAHAVDSVRWEQTNLAGLGYLPSAEIDGVDGPRTHAALKAFQYDNGLDEDGAYGARSDLALHRQVRAVQARAKVAVDGLYGSGTGAAVKNWQGAHGLGADGVAGPATMSGMGVPRTVWLTAQGMFAAHGWSVSAQFSCLKNLWNGESDWKVYATNPSSGAYGIPQALPGSKMATAGSDWQSDPATQISWGLTYISGRYSTPCGAWSAWQSRSPHWY